MNRHLSLEAQKAVEDARQRAILNGWTVAPKPVKKTLLDFAAETIAAKQQWPVGENVTIWTSNNNQTEAFISNVDGKLKLFILKKGRKLSGNVITKGLHIGHNSEAGWVMRDRQILQHFSNYPTWKANAERQLGV